MKTGEYRSKPTNGRKGQLSFDLMFAIIMVLFLVQLLAVVIGENNSTSRSFQQMSLGASLVNNLADQMSAVDICNRAPHNMVEARIKIPDNGLYGDLNYDVTINEDEGYEIKVRTDDYEYIARSSLWCKNIYIGNTGVFLPGDEILIRCGSSGCTCV